MNHIPPPIRRGTVKETLEPGVKRLVKIMGCIRGQGAYPRRFERKNSKLLGKIGVERLLKILVVLQCFACQGNAPQVVTPATETPKPLLVKLPEKETIEVEGTYEGSLSNSEIQPVFDSKGRELFVCYEKEKKKNRYLVGDIRLRFEITSQGNPQNLVVEESTLGNDVVERCIEEIIASLVFPKPKGGSVLAEYPLSFAPKAISPRVGSPEEEETSQYLLSAKLSLDRCQNLPEFFMAAVWISSSGEAKSAGYASEEMTEQDTRNCVIEALQEATYPESKRVMTHLIFSAEDLLSIKRK